MSDEMFYICEWCPEEYCGKTKHELVIVDGKRICHECMENEYPEEPEHVAFVPAHEKKLTDLEQQLADRDWFINDILSDEKSKWSQDRLLAHFDRINRWRGVSVAPALQETDNG